MSVLGLENVGCRLQGRPILSDVSTAIKPGELVALIGPNGAGKSTLLRAMAGIQEGVEGDIRWQGRPLAEWSLGDLARQRGYLAQSATLAWPVTVRHLVGLGRLPHRPFWQGWRHADGDAVERALQRTDTLRLAERAVTTLSGGERLRVLLARLLAAEPQLILADEPLAALDPLHQLQTLQLLRDHCHAGGSAVVALHDLALACRFCDRLLLLDEGCLQADAPPAELVHSGLLERVYRVEFLNLAVDALPVPLPWRVQAAYALQEP